MQVQVLPLRPQTEAPHHGGSPPQDGIEWGFTDFYQLSGPAACPYYRRKLSPGQYRSVANWGSADEEGPLAAQVCLGDRTGCRHGPILVGSANATMSSISKPFSSWLFTVRGTMSQALEVIVLKPLVEALCELFRRPLRQLL